MDKKKADLAYREAAFFLSQGEFLTFMIKLCYHCLPCQSGMTVKQNLTVVKKKRGSPRLIGVAAPVSSNVTERRVRFPSFCFQFLLILFYYIFYKNILILHTFLLIKKSVDFLQATKPITVRLSGAPSVFSSLSFHDRLAWADR